MLKTHYRQELTLGTTCQMGSRGTAVKKVQEWLTLHARYHQETAIATAVDGIYGKATEQAVKNYQQVMALPLTGIVDQALFVRLTQPLTNAFATNDSPTENLPDLMVAFARKHVQHSPTELQYNGQQNLGPWVRSYCDGRDGTDYRWCMGFAQAILDQATSGLNRRFTQLLPQSLSCDTVGAAASQRKALIKNAVLRDDPTAAKPGDIFLLRNGRNSLDWYHTGIVTRVADDFLETIEGNTDHQSSSNGVGVFARVRNFRKSLIDIISLDKLLAG